jgi:putative ABC transport system permease protein
MTLDIVPSRAVNMHRVRGVPLLGVGIAALLAALVLSYTVAAGAASHRRQLAIMRAIGVERRQLRRILLWQGALVLGAALALGLPLGLIGGSKVWTHVARDIGIIPATTTPLWLVVPILAVCVATIAVSGWAGSTRRVVISAQLRAD